MATLMDPLMQWGIEIILSLQRLPGLTGVMHFFTFFGNEAFFLFILPALYWCLDARLGARLAVVLIASNGLNSLFKIAFHLPRPNWIDLRPKVLSFEPSYGLPSGHAMNSLAVWGFLSLWIKKRWLWLTAPLLVFLISLSRLYLGVHFPTDILAGWILGALFLGGYLFWEGPVMAWLLRLDLKQHLILTLILSLSYLAVFTAILKILDSWPDPAVWAQNAALSAGSKTGLPPIHPRNPEHGAAVAGMVLGLGWAFSLSAKGTGSYTALGSWEKKMGRFGIGTGGIFLLATGLKWLTPTDPLILVLTLRYIRYALILFWVFYLAPVLFRKVAP